MVVLIVSRRDVGMPAFAPLQTMMISQRELMRAATNVHDVEVVKAAAMCRARQHEGQSSRSAESFATVAERFRTSQRSQSNEANNYIMMLLSREVKIQGTSCLTASDLPEPCLKGTPVPGHWNQQPSDLMTFNAKGMLWVMACVKLCIHQHTENAAGVVLFLNPGRRVMIQVCRQ